MTFTTEISRRQLDRYTGLSGGATEAEALVGPSAREPCTTRTRVCC